MIIGPVIGHPGSENGAYANSKQGANPAYRLFAFVAPRIDFAMKAMGGDRFKNMKQDTASAYLRRFHYDLILHSPKLTRTLIEQVGVDRVACGTDRPQAMNIPKPVDYVEAIPGITRRQAEMILCENPARLLKLE